MEQVEHKWFDLKSASKKAVANWKTEARRTGGGVNSATPPTEIQMRVISIIGVQSATGVAGAIELETTESKLMEICNYIVCSYGAFVAKIKIFVP